MSEVDAGGEDLAALVLRVLDHAAAQHADLAQRIENGDVRRGLGVGERVVVLGIEEARIFDGDDGGLALALDFGGAEDRSRRFLTNSRARSNASGFGRSIA